MQDRDFLAALRADPGDDLARLAYADWLDERADPRGEFVRMSVLLRQADSLAVDAHLLRADRERLLRQVVRPALQPLAERFTLSGWNRELLTLLQTEDLFDDDFDVTSEPWPIGGLQWREWSEHVPASHPLLDRMTHADLRLLNSSPLPARLPDIVRRCASLTVGEQGIDPAWPDVPVSMFAPAARHLRVAAEQPPAADVLHGLQHLTRLEVVNTNPHGFGSNPASAPERWIARAPASLQSLTLGCRFRTAAADVASLRDVNLPQLTALDLMSAWEPAQNRDLSLLPGLPRLAGLPFFRRLERLALTWHDEPLPNVPRLIARPPSLTTVRVQLPGGLRTDGFDDFLREWAADLECLSIEVPRAGSDPLRLAPLFRSKGLRHLRLSLPLTEEFCFELGTSPLAGRLQSLTIASCELRDRHLEELLRGRWPQLRMLALPHNRLSDRGLGSLLASALANQLEVLDLVGNRHLFYPGLELLLRVGMTSLQVLRHPLGSRQVRQRSWYPAIQPLHESLAEFTAESPWEG